MRPVDCHCALSSSYSLYQTTISREGPTPMWMVHHAGSALSAAPQNDHWAYTPLVMAFGPGTSALSFEQTTGLPRETSWPKADGCMRWTRWPTDTLTGWAVAR